MESGPVSRLLPRPGRAEPRGLGRLSLGRARLCLSRQFVAVGMQRSGNGGASRTGDHRNCNAAEWSGCKADESGRARAEAGRYLARNAEKRKCRRGDAGGGIPNNQPASFLPFAGCGSARCCFFEPRSGELAFPPTSRARSVEPSKRVDWNGGVRAREGALCARDVAKGTLAWASAGPGRRAGASQGKRGRSMSVGGARAGMGIQQELAFAGGAP